LAAGVLALIAYKLDIRGGEAVADWLKIRGDARPVVQVATCIILGFPAIIGAASAIGGLVVPRERRWLAAVALASNVAVFVVLVRYVF
jgi:hypothetical protein